MPLAVLIRPLSDWRRFITIQHGNMLLSMGITMIMEMIYFSQTGTTFKALISPFKGHIVSHVQVHWFGLVRKVTWYAPKWRLRTYKVNVELRWLFPLTLSRTVLFFNTCFVGKTGTKPRTLGVSTYHTKQFVLSKTTVHLNLLFLSEMPHWNWV